MKAQLIFCLFIVSCFSFTASAGESDTPNLKRIKELGTYGCMIAYSNEQLFNIISKQVAMSVACDPLNHHEAIELAAGVNVTPKEYLEQNTTLAVCDEAISLMQDIQLLSDQRDSFMKSISSDWSSADESSSIFQQFKKQCTLSLK